MKCNICGNSTVHLFNKLVLSKYDVAYYQCTKCHFIQTETPYWLEEAYTSAITSSDLGLLYRNLYLQPIITAIINRYFNTRAKFLDYGGGYGVFTRLMRDKGFDYYSYDMYCENLFAKHFDVTLNTEGVRFELLTAFEVFEHLTNPREELNKLLQFSDNLFFSTEIVDSAKPVDPNWWYIIPQTGQHVSLFSKESLAYLARERGMTYYTNGTSLHLFTKHKKISPLLFTLLTRPKAAKLFNLVFHKNESLLNPDYEHSLKLSARKL